MTHPFYVDATTTVYAGESLEVLRELPDNSVDAITTDPPYGLTELPEKKVSEALARWLSGELDFIPAGRGFLGAEWDRFVPPPALWKECLRVLKPGGYLAAFAGARTQDLMGMSIRLAGFRMRDQLHWIRADGFEKSKHVLNGGYEPVILAQAPLDGTLTQTIEKWGTGGILGEQSRTPFRSDADEKETKGKNQHGKYGTVHGGNRVYGDYTAGGARQDSTYPGRWPMNLALDEAAAELVDDAFPGRLGPDFGPSRFYPVFDADPLPFHYAGRATKKERPVAGDVQHNTVKPLSVMEWLVKLLVPENGIVLDPFLGSGTTVEAARIHGRKSIGIEMHEPYLDLVRVRIERTTGE
ncbi:DNA-methyltransferase [Leifsonia sp. Leaf264]|uniref:DNA-methyltransferase n=1 Tax=Leifsonia sp. Leaf264 TaxID=1736314 RepID=UPI00138F9AF6|nr:site-specific DNA-methyltransferase [Leifsonia sp. Leaf264]